MTKEMYRITVGDVQLDLSRSELQTLQYQIENELGYYEDALKREEEKLEALMGELLELNDELRTITKNYEVAIKEKMREVMSQSNHVKELRKRIENKSKQ